MGKSFETSLLVISEILGLFVDTLTADDKYSRHKGENFPQIIQTYFSKKAKVFCGFFIAFLKSA